MNIASLKSLESNFYCTQSYFRHPLAPGVVYTDGARELAQAGEAYWLIDQVALLQREGVIARDPRLQEMQFWTLTREGAKGALLTCDRDEGDTAFSKSIEFTDFPIEQMPDARVRLWVQPTSLDGVNMVKVIFLPSEY